MLSPASQAVCWSTSCAKLSSSQNTQLLGKDPWQATPGVFSVSAWRGGRGRAHSSRARNANPLQLPAPRSLQPSAQREPTPTARAAHTPTECGARTHFNCPRRAHSSRVRSAHPLQLPAPRALQPSAQASSSELFFPSSPQTHPNNRIPIPFSRKHRSTMED